MSQIQPTATTQPETLAAPVETDDFKYAADQFADIEVLRYRVPGWEELSAQEKELAYYLSEAALSGRDIIWDQHFKHNLRIRKTLEAILETFTGDKDSDAFREFVVYAKRVFFSAGIHHHYSTNKILPSFTKAFFVELVMNSDTARMPLRESDTISSFADWMAELITDPSIAPKRINLDPGADLLVTSAMNFYDGVTQKEAEAFYAQLSDPNDKTPISYGLNSRLVKENGVVKEKVYKSGGLYGAAIDRIIFWLEKATAVAENGQQRSIINELIAFYRTGDLKKFDDYSVEWVKDTESRVDFVNGFIEVYGDPLAMRGSFESIVSIKDIEATQRIKAISDNAQWFEDHAPFMPEHKKKNVKGVTAKVITAVMEAGDAAPATPIGVNLPNADWIREQHGSKSVSISNIVHSYNESSKGSGLREEFYFDDASINRANAHVALASDLQTDLHEVIGHGSGQLNPGVGDPAATLKNYAATLEECRADLMALYFIYDEKMLDLGVMPSMEVAKAEYDQYINNGLLIQLARIPQNERILEQAHMRNRQLISKWAYELGKADNVIERKTRDGKTFFVVSDYDTLRQIFGQQLREMQRIKSEGDFAAGSALVETYGVNIDSEIHKEVLERYAKLNLAPYKGFIQPRYTPVIKGDKMMDVKVAYPDDFLQQMLEYGREYAFLPVEN